MKLNLPNKLTLLRVILIPIFMVFVIFPLPNDEVSRLIAAGLFILTAFTDFLDGFIARRFKMITDFGKFLDPLADKMLIFGALLAILVRNRGAAEDTASHVFAYIFVWCAFVIILREMAVTSLRLLVVNKSGEVIAAAWLGKVKTVSQMIGIVVILLDPLLITHLGAPKYLLSYIFLGIMTLMTVWSGLDYIRKYFKLLDPNK